MRRRRKRRDDPRVVTEAEVRAAAMANGWWPDGPPFWRLGERLQLWVGPASVQFHGYDVASLPRKLRSPVCAYMVGFFTKCCPLCGGRVQLLDPADVSPATCTVWPVTSDDGPLLGEGGVLVSGGGNQVVALPHVPICPARPEAVGLLSMEVFA